MGIKLNPDERRQAIASIERYCAENMDDEVGQLAASALLDFFLQEVAPTVYNQAVADAQSTLLARVSELDIEVYAEPFQYWKKPPRRSPR